MKQKKFISFWQEVQPYDVRSPDLLAECHASLRGRAYKREVLYAF
jgi:hypothetical protein